MSNDNQDTDSSTGQIQCPTCRRMLEPGVRFCPHDGTPLTETAGVSTVLTSPGQATRAADLKLPVVVGQRYRLEEVRGGGGMARVYRAVDMTLERDVAVKLINPELRTEPEFDARFQREARIASQLADPHIVVVHDFGIDPEHGPYLVMEYLRGESLRERLQSSGPLPLKAGLQVSAQLLLALIHAHEQGIIHRDIKPDNLFLLSQSGVRMHVRVLDFGIARIMHQSDTRQPGSLTSPGAVLGTPRYMSPEQLAGEVVDLRTDLYSAALVIHEALTGQLPHLWGKRLCEVCPEATEGLEKLLEDCLQPNPADRPASALEVYLRLQELGKASGVVLLPPGAIDRLIAARRTVDSQAALAFPASGRLRQRGFPLSRRQLLLGALGASALVAGGLLAHRLLFPPAPGPAPGEPESLLDVRIGDPQQQVVDALTLTKGGILNPWSQEGRPAWLGHALEPEDLMLDGGRLDRLDVQRTRDDRVTVLFQGGKVVAVIALAPTKGRTRRGLKLGASVGELFQLYQERPSSTRDISLPPEEDPSGKDYVEVRRHDPLGMAFEIHKAQVSAITLFPPRKSP